MKGVLAAILILAFLGLVLALLLGGAILEYPLPGELPLGNALVALGLISLSSIPFTLSRPGTWLRAASAATVVGSVAWLPVSIALAGNLLLNFSGMRGSVWLAFSAGLASAVLAVHAWLLVALLLGLRRRTHASQLNVRAGRGKR